MIIKPVRLIRLNWMKLDAGFGKTRKRKGVAYGKSWTNPKPNRASWVWQCMNLTKQILADPRVASFIQEHSLSQDEIKRSLLSLINSWWNAVRSKKVIPPILPKGMSRFLTMNEGYADVTYKETRQLRATRTTGYR